MVYVLGFVLAWSGIVLIPKTKMINAVAALMQGYVSVMCIGALGALVLSVLSFDITVSSISVVYFVAAMMFWGYIFYKKSIQKLQFRKSDLIGIVVGMIVVCAVAIRIFTIYIYINYNNLVDPSQHFLLAAEIIRTKKIKGMYFTQFHNAMVMQLIMPFLPKAWNYKAFILADCYHTLIEYLFFYGFTLYNMRDLKHNKYLPILISLLYWLGYPLYSFAGGGYIYWAMGAMLVFYVFWSLKIYNDAVDKLNKRFFMALVLLGCYGVTMCYIQFAPLVVIISLAIWLRHTGIKRNIIGKKLLIQLLAFVIGTLILAVIGYYFVFYNNGIRIFEALSMGNNTSKNIEMIFVMPILYYIIYKEIKEKRFNVYVFSLCMVVIYHVVMILFSAVNVVSSYYLFKNNFILWGMLFVVFIEKCNSLTDRELGYVKHYAAFVGLFLLFIYMPEREMETYEPFSIGNSVYRYNAILLKEENYAGAYIHDRTDMMEYIADHFDAAKNGEKVASIESQWGSGVSRWYTGITGQPHFIVHPMDTNDVDNFLRTSGVDYILVYYNSDTYLAAIEYFESFEKVYDTPEGFICRVPDDY